jgi:hypothetical protein
MSRRRQPENWIALEAFGRDLLEFAETRDISKLRKHMHKFSVISVRNMAECIIEIARGADAREVFRQGGLRPGNADLWHQNYTRAFVYWLARAEQPENIDRAVGIAQKHFSYLPAPNRATITRYARKHRDDILLAFDSIKIKDRGKVDTGPLRRHLAAKGKRGRYL